MRKKRGRKGSEGGANWMDTYGDMVTLLLCITIFYFFGGPVKVDQAG